MAVTADTAEFVVLDSENRILEVSPAAQAGFGPLLGKNVLDSFPDSRPLFLPQYEKARRTGEVVEFAQYYDGYVLSVKVVPTGRNLTVSWETLCMLDVLTLEGLQASLQLALAKLKKSEDALRRRRVRGLLRVVEDCA